MSNLGSIYTYRSEVDRIIRFGGSRNEATISLAFAALINAYARPRDLLLVEQLDYFNPRQHKRVTPDGTLKNTLRIDQGFWESKDTDDDLTEEIKKKFDRGYPDSNILTEEIFLSIFSDTQLLEENNIARELKQVENTFFTGATMKGSVLEK